MADVKICDRCGKTIAASTATSWGFGAWRYSLFRRNSSQMTCYEFDVCTDCGEKLARFLKGEELVMDAQGDREHGVSRKQSCSEGSKE